MKLSKKDIIIVNLLDEMIKAGKSSEEILFIASNGLESKQKIEANKLIKRCLNRSDDYQKLAKNNLEKRALNNALKTIGFYDKNND